MRLTPLLTAIAFAGCGELVAEKSPDTFGDTSAIREDTSIKGAFRVPKSAEELVFYNADHSPAGAYASFVYGAEESGGLVESVPVIPETGLIVGTVEDGLLPFVPKRAGAPRLVAKSAVRRTLAACTDSWTAPGGVSWTHFSPSWKMADFESASEAERRRFLLPATWIRLEIDNTAGTADKTLVFGLPVSAKARQFAAGAFDGFSLGANTLAVKAGSCELRDGAWVSEKLGLKSGFAFALTAKPGEKKELLVLVAHHNPGEIEKDGGLAEPTRKMLAQYAPGENPKRGMRYAYAGLFDSPDAVLKCAYAEFPEAKKACAVLDEKLAASGQNEFRRFLAGHSLHSYRFNAVFMRDRDDRLICAEVEGAYNWLNTLDLTVDHVFCQLAIFPWVTRNILDQFADRYRYDEPVFDPATKRTSAEKYIGFPHDMGRELRWSRPNRSGYEYHYKFSMAQEELQNWLLCAGLYWKKTGDDAWLRSRSGIIRDSLASMLARDDLDPAKRDGITTFETRPEGWKAENTTYDALDHALKLSRDNTYIGVKSWATYLAMEAMFKKLGDEPAAATCREQAERVSKTILANRAADKSIPAVLDGKSKSRIIPIIEALVYPQQMGLSEAVSPTGPYAPMLAALRGHMDAVLVPGVCLDSKSGGWKLSATSENTWQSKVYISQHVAESILGMNGESVSGKVDAIHAAFQMSAGKTCWSDQLRSTDGKPLGSLHYPRGATSALWWLAEPPAAKVMPGDPATAHPGKSEAANPLP